MSTPAIAVCGYRPELATRFAELNFEWISRHFEIEAADRKVLLDPWHSIVAPGGDVLFAMCEGDVLGCVALKPVRAGVLELTKMAVRTEQRGRGIGGRLMQAAIDTAQSLGARELVLDTHSSLVSAIALYRRHGFVDVPLTDSPYRRSDVSMRRLLAGHDGA